MSLPSSTLLDALPGSIDAATARGVLLRRQPGDRDLDEVGIAEVARAIEVGAPHRLDLQVQRGCGQQALRLQIEGLEDVEHLDERDAAGARRRHRDDVVAAVGAAHRRALLGLVGGEIVLRDEPAVRLHVVGDAVGNPSLVERVGAAVADRAQRLRQVGQDQPVACRPFAAARLAVGRDRRGKRRHRSLHLAVEAAGEARREREAVRERHRWGDDVLPRQLAELLVRAARGRARCRARPARDSRRRSGARSIFAVGAEVHRPRRLAAAPSRGSRTSSRSP